VDVEKVQELMIENKKEVKEIRMKEVQGNM
jgi:hypothetical protein